MYDPGLDAGGVTCAVAGLGLTTPPLKQIEIHRCR